MTKKSASAKGANTGRPPVLPDSAIICVDGSNSRTILQANSDRRAVINRIIDLGGRATVGELNAVFGFETRPRIMALMREGWLTRTAPRVTKMPRRPKQAARVDA